MSEILYVQTDRNMKVTKEQVRLGEIAKLSCADGVVLARNKVRHVVTLPEGKYGRYVLSATDLIQKIMKEEEHVDVTHIGEPTFVLTFENPDQKNKILDWIKTLLIGILTFFGTAFSIMTFHTDVDVNKLFSDLCGLVTGAADRGIGVLEVSYSIGIGIGVIFYFNHFGKRKLTQDPTPIEVQMRLYEDDVDTTIIEKNDREK